MESDLGNIGVVQFMLEELIKRINTGEVKGLMYQIVMEDGSYLNAWSNNISYTERLGVLESTKQDMLMRIDEEITAEDEEESDDA